MSNLIQGKIRSRNFFILCVVKGHKKSNVVSLYRNILKFLYENIKSIYFFIWYAKHNWYSIYKDYSCSVHMILLIVTISMHSAFAKTISYTGWTLFGLIVCVLSIGVIRFHGDVWSYITHLNTSDWTSMSAIAKTFWGRDDGETMVIPTDSWVILSWDIQQWSGTLMTGIDAYDPTLELDMDASSASGFGFIAPQWQKPEEENWATRPPKDTKQQLMNLIKNREIQTQQSQ